MSKIFVQIGLFDTVEYAFLQFDNYRAINEKHKGLQNLKQFTIPSDLIKDIATFNVVGVDMNPLSIEYNKSRHRHIKFLNRVILDKDIENMDHFSYNLNDKYYVSIQGEETEHGKTFTSKCVTLHMLFDEVIEMHTPDSSIVGCCIDVEGAEFKILNAYNWKYPIDFFSIEVHSAELLSKVLKLLLDKDYYLIDFGYLPNIHIHMLHKSKASDYYNLYPTRTRDILE